jgi:hypothetical protein
MHSLQPELGNEKKNAGRVDNSNVVLLVDGSIRVQIRGKGL